ncbi:unnamed protein product [Ilex paraguariensis]|uniref:Uncharacterized protein n=1 Tax=Ilex paraguariensis TaxID=185542 RepID=A0ABC8TZ68_9AQUA
MGAIEEATLDGVDVESSGELVGARRGETGAGQILMDILNRYYFTIVQMINLNKSAITFYHQQELALYLRIPKAHKARKHLGLPLECGGSKK